MDTTVLREIDLPIMDLERCRELAAIAVVDDLICAGYFNPEKDTAKV